MVEELRTIQATGWYNRSIPHSYRLVLPSEGLDQAYHITTPPRLPLTYGSRRIYYYLPIAEVIELSINFRRNVPKLEH